MVTDSLAKPLEIAEALVCFRLGILTLSFIKNKTMFLREILLKT